MKLNDVLGGRTARVVLGAVGAVATVVALSVATPAKADPPSHAPAWGWRNKDHDKDHGRDRDRDRDRWRDDHRERIQDLRRSDRDRDGIPNWRDRRPNDPRNRWDNRNDRDRHDRDHDGTPDWRDRHPGRRG